jgi:hypothetical protein
MNVKDTNNKLQWIKPQLIVLVRSTPAESVLAGCKYIGAGFGGPQISFNACYWNAGCGPCSEEIKS